jgi:tRNA pseudouridine55 synthase
MIEAGQPATGKTPRRHVDGVLLLDKPVGPSSTRVLGHVKYLLQAAKAGHGGTLDPMASGLLPLMFGDATKFASEGLDADKTYEAEVALGTRTSTGDREGVPIATQALLAPPEAGAVSRVLSTFLGNQLQLPPMHSALKKDGRPLYDYARAGVDVVRTPRAITIHELVLLGIGADSFAIRVTCSKGTYIRTLAEDIGTALGLPAHLRALRRTAVGRLSADDGMVSLESLEQADAAARLSMLKPVDWLIRDVPEIRLGASQTTRFSHGQTVPVSSQLESGRVRAVSDAGRFLGTGSIDIHHTLHPERLRASPH